MMASGFRLAGDLLLVLRVRLLPSSPSLFFSFVFRTIETLFKCFTVCMCIAFPLHVRRSRGRLLTLPPSPVTPLMPLETPFENYLLCIPCAVWVVCVFWCLIFVSTLCTIWIAPTLEARTHRRISHNAHIMYLEFRYHLFA